MAKSDNSKKKSGTASQAQTKGSAQTRYLKGDKEEKTVRSKTVVAENNESTASKKAKESKLSAWEDELNKREVNLIEREMKSFRMQEELDRLRPLSGLYRVVKAMATERRLTSLLETVARETQSMLRADRCSVFVVDSDKGELWTQVAQGLVGYNTIRIPISGASLVANCVRSAQVINIPDAYEDPRFDPAVDKLTGYRTRSVLCVPMKNRSGTIIGVFQVLNKISGPFSGEDEDWMAGLAAVASGLIEQAQAYQEIETFVDRTLEVLAQTIDKRDPLTAGHSVRVTKYSQLIGNSLNLSRSDSDVLRYSAMMHDYGKIGVPESVLWKDGRLTPEEYAWVQKHARFTFELLSNLPFTNRLKDVPFVASCHHEKVDGTGYYRGLKGGEIPFLAKIIAVSDVFDALTSKRHYRNRMDIQKVYEILESGRETHFDPKCVEAFMRLPGNDVLGVMESERDRETEHTFDEFKHISMYRLIELVGGSKARRGEDGLKDKFDQIYNFGLPQDYKALD